MEIVLPVLLRPNDADDACQHWLPLADLYTSLAHRIGLTDGLFQSGLGAKNY